MAAAGTLTDGVTKKMLDGALTIRDGTGSPLSITVNFVQASFTATMNKPHTWHKDRGALDHRRKSKAEPGTVSFEIEYQGFFSSTTDTPSPYEALTKTGQCATIPWVSTTAATSDVYTVDLTLTVTDPIDSDLEAITFDDFACTEISFTEGDEANTLSFSGDWKPADTDFAAPSVACT